MQFYRRALEKTLLSYTKFPVIALLGPRQSGKTMLAKHTFKKYAFVSLDDPEWYALAKADPKGFFRKHENPDGIIIDEFQNVPELLPYLKLLVDEKYPPGYIVLTGSHNFLMNEALTQSLAGRVGILTLLPFSLNELEGNNLLHNEPEQVIFRGGYPRIYQGFEPREFYPSYIRTYIERDVRQLVNVTSIATFQKFLALCAARVGQLLNYSDIATHCGISVPTIHKWLSILEASYIIFLLRPHWKNFSKRIIQTPKLYFYDTGLVTSLLNIESPRSLALSSFYGPLFENFIIADLCKQFCNQGLQAPLYFWRDKNGDIEVDCLISKDEALIPLEIKSGETYTTSYFSSLKKWQELSATATRDAYVVYGGDKTFSIHQDHLVSWHHAGKLVGRI